MYGHDHIYHHLLFQYFLKVHSFDTVDFLIGLDMLKRHRCEISLSHNELRIDSINGVESVNFLSEHDIPKGTFVADTNMVQSGSTSPRSSSKELDICDDEQDKDIACVSLERVKIEHLMALGFDEEQSRNALIQTNGDADMAASLLISSSG